MNDELQALRAEVKELSAAVAVLAKLQGILLREVTANRVETSLTLATAAQVNAHQNKVPVAKIMKAIEDRAAQMTAAAEAKMMKSLADAEDESPALHPYWDRPPAQG